MKEGWEYRKFDDALEKVKYTRKLQTNEFLPEGTFPIISQEEEFISGYWNNKEDLFKVNKPVVIFGDHSRVLKYIDFDFVLGADGVKILEPIDTINAKFLYHFLKWFNVPNMGYSRHYKFLKEINLPIPPLKEQIHIVEELDLLSGIIEKEKAQLEELDKLAQAIFYDMFGDPVTNDKGWEVKRIGEIGEVERGAGISKKDFVEDGLPCIHYGQLHTCLGATTHEHKTCISKDLLPKYKIAHPGDVIMAITSEDVEGSCTSTAWLGDYDIVVGSDAAIFHHSINGVYISYYTRTKAFYNEKAKYAKGFKVTHISTSEIESIPIPLPPLSLQQEFADKVSAIEAMKAKVRQSLAEAEQLFNSRMDYYFN